MPVADDIVSKNKVLLHIHISIYIWIGSGVSEKEWIIRAAKGALVILRRDVEI